VGLVIWFARLGAEHIYWRHPDFEYFYKAGHWLVERGCLDPGYDLVGGRPVRRGSLDWYWPFVPRLMAALALLPYQAAGALWLIVNLAAMVLTLRLIGRHLVGLPPQDWPVTQLLPLLLLAPYWVWEFRLNQINSLTLLLMVASFVCWQQRRELIGGFWLGLATLLKLTPGLLVLWFVLKRQYRTALTAVLTVAAAGPVSDLLIFGPDQTAASYRGWARSAVGSGSHRGLILAQKEMDWRNQGLGAVLSRWLHPTNYNTHFDNDPRIQARYAKLKPQTFNPVSLPLPAVAAIATALAAVSLAGLIWLARRPARRLTAWQLRLEWAIFLLAMLWLMPVMRRYHMIWALPALSILGGAVHYAGLTSRWSKFALSCIFLAVTAELGLLHQPLEAAGTILGSVLVLALPALLMLRRLAQDPRAIREPFYTPVSSAGWPLASPAACSRSVTIHV